MKKSLLNLLKGKYVVRTLVISALLIGAASCSDKEEMEFGNQETMENIPAVLENYAEEIEVFEKDDTGKKSFRSYRKVPTFQTVPWKRPTAKRLRSALTEG